MQGLEKVGRGHRCLEVGGLKKPRPKVGCSTTEEEARGGGGGGGGK
jgi:hypothetical protein